MQCFLSRLPLTPYPKKILPTFFAVETKKEYKRLYPFFWIALYQHPKRYSCKGRDTTWYFLFCEGINAKHVPRIP